MNEKKLKCRLAVEIVSTGNDGECALIVEHEACCSRDMLIELYLAILQEMKEKLSEVEWKALMKTGYHMEDISRDL